MSTFTVSKAEAMKNSKGSVRITNIPTAMTVTKDHLYVAIKSQQPEARHVICEYEMNALDARFNRTWNLCQDVESVNLLEECLKADDEDKMQDECYIFSWEKSTRYPLCERFNKGATTRRFDNCDLGSAKSMADRNGWLENFKPIEGRTIAK